MRDHEAAMISLLSVKVGHIVMNLTISAMRKRRRGLNVQHEGES